MQVILMLGLLLSSLLSSQQSQPGDRTLRMQSVNRAVSWLHSVQRPNGSFGDCSATSAAIQAIAQAGQDPSGDIWAMNGVTPVQWLINGNCAAVRDSGGIAKIVLGLAAAGKNPRSFNGVDYVAPLQAAYDSTKHTYHSFSNYRHALVLRALAAAHAPIHPEAIQLLRDQQRPDGGWGWPYDVTEPSEVDTTGQVMMGLIAAGVPASDPIFSRADAYLRQTEQPGANWAAEGYNPDPSTPQPPNANSTALALSGLVAAGRDPTAAGYVRGGTNPVAGLLAFQESSGAFVFERDFAESRLLATLDAINALAPAYPGDPPLTIPRFFPVAGQRMR